MRILITAGGTREPIDPVRFISNASSGRMGIGLARAAMGAGHQVTLILAPTALQPPRTAEVVQVTTAGQMFLAVRRLLASHDCLIMAAAVSDYTPAKPSKTKIKKTGDRLVLELKPTVDILKWAGTQNRTQNAGQGRRTRDRVIVGFALEDRDVRKRAQGKLRDKHLDMVVANTPAAIGADRSSLQVKTRQGPWIELPMASKPTQARRIIRMIEQMTVRRSDGRTVRR